MPLSPELEAKARELVDRADCGDQNAMGLIEQIGRNARGGHAVAQASHAVIVEYARAKPKRRLGPVSGDTRALLQALRAPNLPPPALLALLCALPSTEEEGGPEAACVLLAAGPVVSAPAIRAVQACLPPECHEAFEYGLANSGDPQAMRAGKERLPPGPLCAGECLGHARRLQAIRQGAPLGFLSADMGWELDPTR